MAFSPDDQQDAEGEFLADVRLCACPDPDPRRCYDLREYGHTPVHRGQAYAEHFYVMQETLTWAELDDYECPCVCHAENEEDEEEAGDGDD